MNINAVPEIQRCVRCVSLCVQCDYIVIDGLLRDGWCNTSWFVYVVITNLRVTSVKLCLDNSVCDSNGYVSGFLFYSYFFKLFF